MNTIQIDDEVYKALATRVSGFNQQPNDVIRSLLGLNNRNSSLEPPVEIPPNFPPILQFIENQNYRLRKTGIDKYLLLLEWLWKNDPKNFERIKGFDRGRRVYFSTDPKLIAASGQSLSIKQIPNSPYYALATLDNRTKRLIMTDVLNLLGYPMDVSRKVAETIEDSGIRRSRVFEDAY